MLNEIKEAIKGGDRDYTSGSIRKAIFLLSIPMVLEMMMESIFAITDIYFVSKINADAVATVGITESLLTIIYAVAIGLSMSATAIISRRIGEKKFKEASNAAFQAIITGIIPSLVIAIIGIAFATDILILMGTSAQIANSMHGYTTIMLSGNLIIMLLFIINGIFRSAGDAAIAMRVLWLANGINIILDPCLIFGWGPFPELGITGAAIATNIGRGTAVIYQLYLLIYGKGKIKLNFSMMRPDYKVIVQLIRLSYGTISQFIIATSSWIGLVRIISIFGSEVLAGYTIGIRIIIFAILPALGLSNAAGTLVGQNLGAGKPDRAEKSAWIAGKINILLMGIIGLILILFSEFWVGLLIDKQNVISAGANCLKIISYGFIAYGLGMVLIHSINGSGDTMTPMKINILCFWIIEIPLAYVLSIQLELREKGVFYSIVIAETIMTVLAVIVFRVGKWKLRKV